MPSPQTSYSQRSGGPPTEQSAEALDNLLVLKEALVDTRACGHIQSALRQEKVVRCSVFC